LIRRFVNVGVLGRPDNEGRITLWYTLLGTQTDLSVTFVPVEYDQQWLACEIRDEKLPGGVYRDGTDRLVDHVP